MLCGPNLKNSSDLLIPLNMLLISGYPESLEETILLCLRKSWASLLAAARAKLVAVLETLQLHGEFVAPQGSRFLGREVKDSDVLWSVVVLGGILPVVSLSGVTRREGCLNMEQPSWECGAQTLSAVRGGDEVKEQVHSCQQGLELKKRKSLRGF